MTIQVRCAVLCLFVIVTLNSIVSAQEVETPPPVTMTPLTGTLHLLRCNDNVAVVASIGEDGILLVDSGYTGTAEAVHKTLSQFGDSPVKIILNTHGDADHVGGNAVLGRDALIVALPEVRDRMSGYYSLPVTDDSGLPTMTVVERTTLYFNGEVIELVPVPGGHTAGDMVVHFTKNKVVCLGDIVLTGTLPDADPGRGGNAQHLTQVLRDLLNELPPDTIMVPGHGENITAQGLQAYLAMVEGSLAAVRKVKAEGYSLDETLELNPLAAWKQWESPEEGLTFADWTTQIFASLGEQTPHSICEPLTETLQRDGIEAAIEEYRKLKVEEPQRWDFGEDQLNMLGYQLLQRQRIDEAIEIFKLNVEAFPQGFNAYDSLGEAFMVAGEIEPAITNYTRSLQLNPDNTNAVLMLGRLRGDGNR